jgi:hypothetical protein
LNLEASSSSESLLLPLSSLNPVGEQQFCFCISAVNECVVCLFVSFSSGSLCSSCWHPKTLQAVSVW